MSIEKVDTLVVGAGQAGLAASEHLSNNGVEHLVLERARIAECWRTARWDSLVANGPAWHDRFPTMEFECAPGDFPGKDEVTAYFEAFARKIAAPVRCGVEVTRLAKHDGGAGYLVDTSDGRVQANNVICATGPFQQPVIPPLVPELPGLLQMHSHGYRSPQQLPPGAVLVVGSGSSGSQIADELLRSGRRVFLSVGPHDRPPRSYRGRDFVWWLGVLGKWDLATVDPDTAHVTIAVSGALGGHTVDFRRFAQRGMTLLGMTGQFSDGRLSFADDLQANINSGDANYLAMLDEADAYVERNGLDLPEEPSARIIDDDPACLKNPVRSVDLADENITSIIWATGYRNDFNWMNVDVFDADGKPVHVRGVSQEQGIYFLGLPWLSRRGSSFIWGVWHDAKYVADHITTQHRYLEHHATIPAVVTTD